MKKLIPRHCLVVAIGPNNNTRSDIIARYFRQHEIVSSSSISYQLIGQREPSAISSLIFAEMKNRTATKLSLGERVIIDAPNLRREDRLAIAQVAIDAGVPVFYLLADPTGAGDQAMQRWRSAQRDLLRGDGVAEPVDTLLYQLEVIDRERPLLTEILSRWAGITVVADVHGMQQSLLAALSWARSRNHYVIFLGDVVDYGPQTLEVADTVYSMVMRGDGELLMGNHERKIMRWLNHRINGRYPIVLSDGNKVTTDALGQLSTKAANKWAGRFIGLTAHAAQVRELGNFTFAHASVHPHFWNGTATPKELETSALFGEFEQGRKSNVYIPRSYGWVSKVPLNRTVIVGHDIRSKTFPLTVTSSDAGRTIFLDTGCGKGGFLSTCDLRPNNDGLTVSNFNMF